MLKIIICEMLLIILVLNISMTYGESLPRSIATDTRVKVVNYDPNNIVILKSRYGYQTHITFGVNEIIQNISIGDSLAWLVVPVNNNLFIKPVAQSKTNMTVLTNQNSYNFQIDSLNPKVAPTYKLQFNYKNAGFDEGGHTDIIGTFDPAKLNWKYSYMGERSLAPIQAFDNGRFTYFKFQREGLNHQPSVFIVNKRNKETLVNYHIQGEYTVINSVAKKFALRDGASIATVYNESVLND